MFYQIIKLLKYGLWLEAQEDPLAALQADLRPFTERGLKMKSGKTRFAKGKHYPLVFPHAPLIWRASDPEAVRQ